ncbi:MAG: 4Fe-4S dicluster domain-containing protein [Deltaproteobacteria bacterium]|nr:4Fe-4S dicluster domain-containing protein [Deltaproteobacteria bacterium]
MMLTISLYISLAIFIIGLLYKISRWLSLKTTVQSMDIPASKRASSALKGIALAIFSGRILRLIKAFFLDVILQRKVLREDLFRWITHMLIYGAFMLLVLMHALENVITAAIFDTYASTVNPFLFLRDLFGLLVIVGVCMAVYRRYILKSPRLTTNPMDIYTIVLIAFIMVSGILLEATKIGSYSRYKDMVEEWAGLEEEEEEFKALTAFWVQEYATVAPDIEGPFEPEVLELGKEVHEMSCAACHSKPQWAFTSFPVAKAVKGIALDLDRAGVHTLLWNLHFLACFIGLAYLPFSKFFHIITSPLSLLVNSVMNGEKSDPANIATKQALEFDACMHCGNCTNRCSLGVLFERMGNVNILPSEKMQSLPRVISGRQTDEGELQLILDGTYLCTNCHRCTDVCPAGINLEELWFAMRENLFQRGHPEFSLLSPLSFYRGLMRDHIPPEQYKGPLVLARDRIAADCELLKDQSKPVDLSLQEGELKGELLLSDQASTFSACFGCQTCTNVCPVVANYENPKEALGMLPHQIMYALGLSIKDLAFGSNMLWDCVTCYQCQEQCPQGVKVTEVLYELKNLAIQSVAEKVG